MIYLLAGLLVFLMYLTKVYGCPPDRIRILDRDHVSRRLDHLMEDINEVMDGIKSNTKKIIGNTDNVMNKYPTFRTACYKCSIPLRTVQFHVHMGSESFALCPKHLEELKKLTSKFVKKKNT